jgi:hypothetical protein
MNEMRRTHPILDGTFCIKSESCPIAYITAKTPGQAREEQNKKQDTYPLSRLSECE